MAKFRKIHSSLQGLGWLLVQPWDLWGAILLRIIAPLWSMSRASGKHPWVMGGHRGRMRGDNAGELHQFLLSQDSPKVLWIANAPLAKVLQKHGIPVLRRNSWRARLAILKAPVLIFSHGEDDLDQYALLWRGKLGLRVHLNHCMNHLKAGQWYRKDVQNFGRIRKRLFQWLMVDFDLLPASSELEKKHFQLSMPHLAHKIAVGGGAHIDGILRLKNAPSDRSVFWFPTFRDQKLEALGLQKMIQQVTRDAELLSWLEQENRTLKICHHINSGSPVSRNLPQNARIQFTSPSRLIEDLAHAEIFISDYSGLTADWLALQRPMIFFAFDLEAYLQTRNFYIPYGEYAYGPVIHNLQDLKSCLANGTWKNLLTPAREKWHKAMFPHQEIIYAQRTFQTIWDAWRKEQKVV